MSLNLRGALALLYLSLVPAAAMGQVTIVSPASNRTVTSPVRVAAEFPNTAGIVSTTITVDNVGTPGGNVTPLDVDVPMSQGNHFLTVAAVQADGSTVSASQWVKVGAPATSASASTQSVSPSTSSTTRVHTDIEEKSGWYLYPDLGHPGAAQRLR